MPASAASRELKELHRQTADSLAADHATRAEVERLLSELQQLLAGISIMQVDVMTACNPVGLLHCAFISGGALLSIPEVDVYLAMDHCQYWLAGLDHAGKGQPGLLRRALVNAPVRSAPRCQGQCHRKANRCASCTPRAGIWVVLHGKKMSSMIMLRQHEAGQPRCEHALRVQGVPAQQYDAWDIGVTTNDCFGNADVLYPVTLPAVRDALTRARAERAHIPVVTGFLGRGLQTRAFAGIAYSLWIEQHGILVVSLL